MHPHSTRASTPSWRLHQEYRKSVSQFSKLADPRTSCICQQSRRQIPMFSCQGDYLGYTKGVATSMAVFTFELAIFLYCICTILGVVLSACPPVILSAMGICSSPRPACAHSSSPLGTNMQAFPFRRLFFLVQHVLQPKPLRTIWRTRSTVRSHGNHQGPFQV